jgi:catecholate siderophore receptor
MVRVWSLSLVASLLGGASPVLAAEAADSADPAAQAEIVVVGERGEYGVSSTSTATKTDTAIRNIPQAMTVISESQIEDQNIRSIAELLTFVPGATPGTGESNRDQITLRGNNSTADFFIDGVRDDVQYFRDFYNVDRVEILKGPNAMIFGRGGGGGVVNRVMKRSTLNSYREGLASTASFGGFRLTGDIDQPLGSNAGLRVNGLYENGESFRRHVNLERYGINPTAGITVGPATRIDLGYEYFHDRRTTDRGVPADGARPLKGFDRTFFGDPDASFARADVNIATVGIEHELASGLKLKSRALLGVYDKFYQNIYPSDLIEASNEVVLGAYNSRNDRRNLISQTDLVWDNRLAGIDQTLLLGVELGRQKSRNFRQTGTIAGGNRVPLSDPTVDVDVTFARAGSDADNRTRASFTALYVQDQIRPADWLEIVAGLRFDSFRLRVDDFRPVPQGGEFSRRDRLWSPRLGVIVKPLERLSLYGSFSRSYLPQSGDQFSGLDVNTETLKPERFDNLEAGAKWEPIEGLLATAAVYQLDRTNTRVANPDGSGTFLLTGAQRTRGLELGLERSITDRWQVSAGYALQKAEIIERTTACNPAAARCEVPLVPRHSFALWNRYDLNRRVGAGVGVIARSKSFASISNAVTLPAYTRVDGALFYKLPNGMEAQLNVENILGIDYFPTAHSDNNIAPGGPRTLKATVGYRF